MVGSRFRDSNACLVLASPGSPPVDSGSLNRAKGCSDYLVIVVIVVRGAPWALVILVQALESGPNTVVRD